MRVGDTRGGGRRILEVIVDQWGGDRSVAYWKNGLLGGTGSVRMVDARDEFRAGRGAVWELSYPGVWAFWCDDGHDADGRPVLFGQVRRRWYGWDVKPLSATGAVGGRFLRFGSAVLGMTRVHQSGQRVSLKIGSNRMGAFWELASPGVWAFWCDDGHDIVVEGGGAGDCRVYVRPVWCGRVVRRWWGWEAEIPGGKSSLAPSFPGARPAHRWDSKVPGGRFLRFGSAALRLEGRHLAEEHVLPDPAEE